MSRNPWIWGVILLIVGPIVAMCGKRWFPYVAASVGAVLAIDSVIVLFAESGIVENYWALSGVFALALITGVMVGILLRRNIKIATTIVGAISGGILGAFLYEIVFAIWDMESSFGLILTSIVFAVLAAVIT